MSIDPKTGDYETFRLWEIVSEEEIEDSGTQVLQSEENSEIGSFVKEKVDMCKVKNVNLLPSVDLTCVDY